jgi:phosphoribosylanthranilate isomerase
MNSAIKICGLKTPEAVDAATRAGATHLGFNFYDASPRLVSTAAAAALSALAPALESVALTVDASDALLDQIVREAAPSLLQLHGNETPERVSFIKSRFGLRVMKAVAIASAADVRHAHTYEHAADWLLFDAKPDALPGGNGLTFDWQLIANEKWSRPWMLSGGLTAANVADAVRISHARGVDVSSGVEKSRGEKDPILIERFIVAAQKTFAEDHLK